MKSLRSVCSLLSNGRTPARDEYSDFATQHPIIKVASYSGDLIDLTKVDFAIPPQAMTARRGDIFILSAAHQPDFVGRFVKLLDEDTRKDLNEFANATASSRRRDAKTITVTSDGQGQREMVVSYTISAPIWKTTYRVVLDEQGKPFFQGWAIVDNVSEEDWQNVQLSLVSGSPVSFIQNLQKPFYRYRPVIATPQDLQLRPQIYEPGGNSAGWGRGPPLNDAGR